MALQLIPPPRISYLLFKNSNSQFCRSVPPEFLPSFFSSSCYGPIVFLSQSLPDFVSSIEQRGVMIGLNSIDCCGAPCWSHCKGTHPHHPYRITRLSVIGICWQSRQVTPTLTCILLPHCLSRCKYHPNMISGDFQRLLIFWYLKHFIGRPDLISNQFSSGIVTQLLIFENLLASMGLNVTHRVQT